MFERLRINKSSQSSQGLQSYCRTFDKLLLRYGSRNIFMRSRWRVKDCSLFIGQAQIIQVSLHSHSRCRAPVDTGVKKFLTLVVIWQLLDISVERNMTVSVDKISRCAATYYNTYGCIILLYPYSGLFFKSEKKFRNKSATLIVDVFPDTFSQSVVLLFSNEDSP